MKDNDSTLINQVVDFYYSTIDESHPQGNMSAVAEHFSITRAKVNKILITAGVIDSPLHQDILKLKERGYDTDDIASALGVSAATIKINMPYEKVIYNGERKSSGAVYTEEFRKREQVFLSNVVRKKTCLEREREGYYRDLSGEQMHDFDEQELSKVKELLDDPIHLMPEYTDEEAKLFKMIPNVMVLHIELDADLTDVKDLAEIKYPSLFQSSAAEKREEEREKFTISRDILVPDTIPLHNLHYAINQAFGFTNSHLHTYTLSDHDLMWFTEGKVSKWKKYTGLLFKNPVRDENIDFWDDDYEGGSPKKWMRSKYTGPIYYKVIEELYGYAQKQMKSVKVRAKTIEDLRGEFEFDPLALNEALPVCEIFSEDGQDEYAGIEEYNANMKECFEDAAQYPEKTIWSQPYVCPFADTIQYNYDFGDNWYFTIKAMKDAEYLAAQRRITGAQMKEAIKDVCTLYRPVVIAADGLPLVEDVGGAGGYADFLKGIHGQDSTMYADKEDSLAWAKGNGWSGKVGNLKTML